LKKRSGLLTQGGRSGDKRLSSRPRFRKTTERRVNIRRGETGTTRKRALGQWKRKEVAHWGEKMKVGQIRGGIRMSKRTQGGRYMTRACHNRRCRITEGNEIVFSGLSSEITSSQTLKGRGKKKTKRDSSCRTEKIRDKYY